MTTEDSNKGFEISWQQAQGENRWPSLDMNAVAQHAKRGDEREQAEKTDDTFASHDRRSCSHMSRGGQEGLA